MRGKWFSATDVDKTIKCWCKRAFRLLWKVQTTAVMFSDSSTVRLHVFKVRNYHAHLTLIPCFSVFVKADVGHNH